MIYVFLGTGFEETEAITPVDLMRRAGLSVMTVGLSGKTVVGSHNIPVVADITIDEMDLSQMEMLMLPGGLGGVRSIRSCPKAMDAIAFAGRQGIWLAAICAGPTVLASLGITDGLDAVCYPGCEGEMGSAHMHPDKPCIRSGHVITGASAGCAVPFGLELIAALKGDAEAEKIARQIVIR